MMKKLFSIITIIGLSVSSCNKILDEQVPAHKNVDYNVITDQKTAETALVGVYSYLAGGYQWEWHYGLDFSHLCGTSRGSGSSSGGLEAGYEGELIFNTMRADGSYSAKWQGAYKIINAANWVLKLIENVDESLFTADRKKQIIAETRFMRFFANFFLFRNYCYFFDINSEYGLLYRDEPVNLTNFRVARLNVKDSYDKLIEDLDYCIANGPEFSTVYRASKQTAKAFKAKLLAMRGGTADWNTVITLTNEVITSGKFAMESDHYSIFKKRNASKEVIFSLFISPNTVASNLGTVRCRWSGYYRATDFLKSLSNIGTQYNKAINDTINTYTASTNTYSLNYGSAGKIASYGVTDAELVANSAFIYLRLGEMQILKAEAIARTTGSVSEVLSVLNPLLVRAKDTPFTEQQISGNESLLNFVYLVLLKELALESGIDYEASLRFKDSNGLPKIIGQKQNLSTIDDIKKCVKPIHVNEIVVNDLCKQNPGY
ncbi:MAG: RagB/SusD family nutrient uptake outer membrane protein [Bacteroidales bacterium]